jgi:hypothetical protein
MSAGPRGASLPFTLAIAVLTSLVSGAIVLAPTFADCSDSSEGVLVCLRTQIDRLPLFGHTTGNAGEGGLSGWIDARANEPGPGQSPPIVLDGGPTLQLNDGQVTVPAVVQDRAGLVPSGDIAVASTTEEALASAFDAGPLQSASLPIETSAALVATPPAVEVALIPDTLDIASSVDAAPSSAELTSEIGPADGLGSFASDIPLPRPAPSTTIDVPIVADIAPDTPPAPPSPRAPVASPSFTSLAVATGGSGDVTILALPDGNGTSSGSFATLTLR